MGVCLSCKTPPPPPPPKKKKRKEKMMMKKKKKERNRILDYSNKATHLIIFIIRCSSVMRLLGSLLYFICSKASFIILQICLYRLQPTLFI